MFKTTWKQLEPATRAELETLLATPTDAFLADYDEMLGFGLLAMLVCLGGAGVAVWDLATDTLSLGELAGYIAASPTAVLRSLPIMGFVLATVVGVWVGVTLARNYRRRGYAALSNAIVVVRGGTLKVFPYRDIVGADQRVIGTRGNRFTVLTLQYADGTKHDLNVHGRWAKEALERWAQSRGT